MRHSGGVYETNPNRLLPRAKLPNEMAGPRNYQGRRGCGGMRVLPNEPKSNPDRWARDGRTNWAVRGLRNEAKRSFASCRDALYETKPIRGADCDLKKEANRSGEPGWRAARGGLSRPHFSGPAKWAGGGLAVSCWIKRLNRVRSMGTIGNIP